MGFIDESELDPIPSLAGESNSSIGGRFIRESDLDPIPTEPSFRDRFTGTLKGVGEGALSLFTAPADLLFRGGNKVIDSITGNNTDLTGAYPSDRVESFYDWVSGNTGSEKSENTGKLAGALMTGLKVPSLATQLPKTASPVLNALARTSVSGLEGAGYSVLGNAKNEDLTKDVGLGAILGSGGQVLGDVLSASIDPLKDIAGKLSRKSIGARYSDYAKDAKDIGILNLPNSNAETKTKSYIDDIIESGILGESRNPEKMLPKLEETQKALSKEARTIINSAKNVKVKPTFDEALAYIERSVPADKVEPYLNRLAELESQINKEGKGSLEYLQNQKIAHGSLWSADDSILNGFNRAIYDDLKTSIEKVVPSISGVNKKLEKINKVKPIIERSLALNEAGSPAEKAKQFFYTTTGYGVPIGLGASFGGPIGAAAGVAGGKLLSYLASPQGMKQTSKVIPSTIIPSIEKASSLIKEGSKTIPFLKGYLQDNKSENLSIEEKRKLQSENAPDLGAIAIDPQTKQPQLLKKQELSPNNVLKKQLSKPDSLKTQTSQLDNFLGIEDSRSGTSYDDTETTPYNFIDLALNRAISQIDDADLQKTLPKGKKMTGDIDLDALKQSVIKQESAGNAKATSPKGAQGLMQLMPATGKELAKEIGVKYDPYDAEQNQELGMLYLTKQLKTFGSMELALAAYNAGPARVKDWQRKYGTTWRQIEQALLKRGSFKETTDYVNKIKKNYESKAKKSTGAIEI